MLQKRRGRWPRVLILVAAVVALAACGQAAQVVESTATSEPMSSTPLPASPTPPTETRTPAATATLSLPTGTPTPVPELQVDGAPVEGVRLEPAACQFAVPAGRKVECGYLVVPENRDQPDPADMLRLHVARFHSESDDPAPDPIIYLEGGPGGDALETVPLAFEDRFAPFLAERDFIMFDQRGTGYSVPSLACPEYKALSLELLDDILEPEEAFARRMEALRACRERLAGQGVDFTAYHSRASAADVEDLRRLLGYDEVNLLGISYGTRLAQTIMRLYPDGVRSVVLDSTLPVAANLTLETPTNVARAFRTFFDACAADSRCSNAYPNLEAEFWDLVEQLDEEPITVPVRHPLTGQRYEAAVAGDDLIATVFRGLYSEEIIPALPRLIMETKAGYTQLLGLLLSNMLLNNEFSSIGMHFSVQCNEENAFINPEEARPPLEDYPRLEAYFEQDVEETLALCAMWQAGMAPPEENLAVESNIPVLILAGSYDPITPPAWGEAVAKLLPNSLYLEFPSLAHGVSVSGECPRSVTLEFLETPTETPDASCIEEMDAPPFMLPRISPGAALPLDLRPAEG